MAVYVDHAQIPFRGMLMSHLFADTTEELLQMVDSIGVQRRWIQDEGTYREHFDISDSKRQLAVARGAIPIGVRDVAALLGRRRAARQEAAR